MKKQELLDEILLIIHSVREDKNKLELIRDFLMNEFYTGPAEIEIPERYKKIIPEIAENIDTGMFCFLNLDTLEIENIPQHLMLDPDEYELMTGESFDSLELKHPNWDNCISFEPLESRDSFEIMEGFIEAHSDKNFKLQLFNALNRKKPFANFKDLIDNSPYRQDWFNFKQKQIESYVIELLLDQLEEIQEDYHEEINGIYNDDGTKVDPQSIPLPGLCIICKKYKIDDWEENLLCLMNRNDQRNDDEFRCGTFENM